MKNDNYAGLGRRFLALFIDGLILSSLFFPVTRIIKGTWLMRIEDHDWTWQWIAFDPLCLTFLCIIFLYFVLFESFSATPGKYFLKLRVYNTDGKKPGIWRSFVRNILRFVDSLPALNILAVYLIITHPENARFGDQVAGTRVVLV